MYWRGQWRILYVYWIIVYPIQGLYFEWRVWPVEYGEPSFELWTYLQRYQYLLPASLSNTTITRHTIWSKQLLDCVIRDLCSSKRFDVTERQWNMRILGYSREARARPVCVIAAHFLWDILCKVPDFQVHSYSYESMRGLTTVIGDC